MAGWDTAPGWPSTSSISSISWHGPCCAGEVKCGTPSESPLLAFTPCNITLHQSCFCLQPCHTTSVRCTWHWHGEPHEAPHQHIMEQRNASTWNDMCLNFLLLLLMQASSKDCWLRWSSGTQKILQSTLIKTIPNLNFWKYYIMLDVCFSFINSFSLPLVSLLCCF